MHQPKMSAEWDEYASKTQFPPKPKNVSEVRAAKLKRGLDTQALLSTPALALLANKVEVANTEICLPEVPGHKFPLRIYKPAGYSGVLPVLLYFHGGYWCSGDANSEDLGCRAIIARGANVIVASFGYRLVPDVAWHELFSDAEYAMKWMSTNAASIGGDVSKGFLVGGAEAGEHLAAITAIRARNRYPDIKLTGQLLVVPMTIAWPDPQIPADWVARMPSHKDMSHAPLFDEDLYEFYVRTLNVPDEEKRKGENFPMWGPLEGLPPTYLAMDECDPIRDQGFLYAELLQEAGIKTRVDYYEGLPNMFVQFPDLPPTQIAGIQLSAAVRWLLADRK